MYNLLAIFIIEKLLERLIIFLRVIGYSVNDSTYQMEFD